MAAQVSKPTTGMLSATTSSIVGGSGRDSECGRSVATLAHCWLITDRVRHTDDGHPFVVAGGAVRLGAMAGVTVPLHSAEHYYLTTEPMAGVDHNTPVLRDPVRPVILWAAAQTWPCGAACAAARSSILMLCSGSPLAALPPARNCRPRLSLYTLDCVGFLQLLPRVVRWADGWWIRASLQASFQ